MSSPAVVLKSKFIGSGSKQFKDFIDYIDREDAKLNVNIDRNSDNLDAFDMFHSFMDYMGDEEKQGELFNTSGKSLDKKELKKLKKDFMQAQNSDSPMWQDVISFDNEWLESQGVYDSSTHKLDEEKMRQVVCEVMDFIIEKEKMVEPVWAASFHYNTDNIHVHMASVELDPSHRETIEVKDEENNTVVEYRAKRKQSTLDKIKSIVVRNLYDRNKDYEKIDALIREPARQKRNISMSINKDVEFLLLKAIELMPSDLRQWRYGYNSIDEARPYIDAISEAYMKEYHEEEYKELILELDKQNEINEDLYGEKSEGKNYKANKLGELKRSLGNAVIDEMKELKKRNDELEKEMRKPKKAKQPKSYQQVFLENHQRINLQRSLRDLNFRMRKSYQQHKRERDNMEEFERMLENS